MKSKACRWKIKPLHLTPPLKFYRTFLSFYWATWKCFMGNLRDTGGYHLWSRVRTLDSSNTSLVSLSLGKTANLPLIRVIAELSVPSVSGGWGVGYAFILLYCTTQITYVTLQSKYGHTVYKLTMTRLQPSTLHQEKYFWLSVTGPKTTFVDFWLLLCWKYLQSDENSVIIYSPSCRWKVLVVLQTFLELHCTIEVNGDFIKNPQNKKKKTHLV